MEDYIENLPANKEWPFRNIIRTENLNPIAGFIKRKNYALVSDGSYFPAHQVGSCAWIVSTPDGSEWIEGVGVIPGATDSQSAYRSELGRLLGLLLFLHSIDLPPCPRPAITIACDGKSALTQIGKHKRSIKSNSTHIDLISALHEVSE